MNYAKENIKTPPGPQTYHFIFESVDHDGNDIVVAYTTWHDLYLWEVTSWSPTTMVYTELHNDNGVITTHITPWLSLAPLGD